MSLPGTIYTSTDHYLTFVHRLAMCAHSIEGMEIDSEHTNAVALGEQIYIQCVRKSHEARGRK